MPLLFIDENYTQANTFLMDMERAISWRYLSAPTSRQLSAAASRRSSHLLNCRFISICGFLFDWSISSLEKGMYFDRLQQNCSSRSESSNISLEILTWKDFSILSILKKLYTLLRYPNPNPPEPHRSHINFNGFCSNLGK